MSLYRDLWHFLNGKRHEQMVHAPRGVTQDVEWKWKWETVLPICRFIPFMVYISSLYSTTTRKCFLESQDRLGQDHEISLYLGDAVDAGEGHGHVELRPEQLEHLLDAPLPVAGQTPDDGAADEDHPGAQGQRLQHVRAQGHAAVEVYLGWDAVLIKTICIWLIALRYERGLSQIMSEDPKSRHTDQGGAGHQIWQNFSGTIIYEWPQRQVMKSRCTVT